MKRPLIDRVIEAAMAGFFIGFSAFDMARRAGMFQPEWAVVVISGAFR